MLQHLYIQNYALIESLDIDFNEGFTVITGETGAGKSILLGALNLILGKRADIASLKDKSKKCIVEATFKIKDYGLKPLFEQNDLDYEDQTIFRREINVGGKSRAFINDTPVNLNLIKNIGDRLINIHSQDDQISLGDSAFQMAVVDSVAGAGELNLKYKKQYKLFIQLRSRLDALYEQQKQASDEKDYLQFLFDELEETQMKSGEQEQLEEEQELLNHTEEIKGTLYKANQNLNDDEEGILQNLATLKSNIEKISGYSPTLSDIASRVNSAFIELSDLSDEIEKFSDSVHHNPGRADEIQARLDTLYNLQNKHRVNSLEALFAAKNEIETKLNGIQNLDEEINSVSLSLKSSEEALKQQAEVLTKRREGVFKPIQESVEATLKSLGMPHAQIALKNQKQEIPGVNGFDHIIFQFNANKGQELQDVAKVASGGEKSRLMLAIKSLISQKNLLPTIIFDEIDAGVSGEIEKKTGQILAELSKNMQVFAITHLPQIAGLGTDHLMVYKDSTDEKTKTSLKRLNTDDRIIEIAKLLSGQEITEASVQSARHLLKN